MSISPLPYRSFFDSYREARNPKERAKVQSELGELLFSPDASLPTVTQDQLLQMHVPFDIQGGNVEENVRFWINFLECWLEGKHRWINFKISDGQLHQCLQALKDYEALRILQLSALSSEEIATQSMERIERQLKEKKFIYIPKGWCETAYQKGHVFACRLEINDERRVTAYLLNRGRGSECHPWLDLTPSGYLASFRYFPIHFSRENFSSLHHAILLKDISLQRSECFGVPFGKEDVYDPLILLGTVEEDYETFWVRSIKPQWGDNCVEEAIRLVLQDLLVETIPLREVKRFFFNAKFCSLLSAANHCNEEDLPILERAARHFAVAIDKSYPEVLSSSELFLSQTLVENILLRCQQRPAHSLAAHVTSFDLSTLKEVEEVPFKIPPPSSLRSFQTSIELKYEPPLSLNPFQMEDAVSCLVQWEEALSTLPLHEREALFFAACRSLPLPQIEGEDPWDQLPQDAIEPVIQQLYILTWDSLRNLVRAKWQYSLLEGYLTALTFYAIADKLSRKISTAQLAGFHSPLWQRDSIPPLIESLTIFNFHRDKKRVEQLLAYFHHLKTAHPRPLFCFDPSIDLMAGLQAVRRERHSQLTSPQLIGALHYLLQFNAPIEASELVKLWVSPPCPPVVDFLRKISFLVYQLGNTSIDISFSGEKILKPLQWQVEDRGSSLLVFSDQQRNPQASSSRRDMRPLFPLSFPCSKEEIALLGGIQQSENQVLCSKMAEDVATLLDEEEFHTFLYLFCEPEMQLSSALQWLKRNYRQLSLKKRVWWNALEALFLNPTLLATRLQQNPLYRDALHEIFHEAISYYQEEWQEDPLKKETLLFLVSLACRLETHLQALFSSLDPADDEGFLYAWMEVAALVAQDRQVDSLLCFVALTEHCKALSKDTVFAMGLLQFLGVLQEETWISYQAMQQILLHQAALAAFLQEDPDLVQTLCHACASYLIKDPPLVGWKGAYPVFSSGSLQIDLRNGLLKSEAGIKRSTTSSLEQPLKVVVEFPFLGKKWGISSESEEAKKMSRLKEVLWEQERGWRDFTDKIRIERNDKKGSALLHLRMKTHLGEHWYTDIRVSDLPHSHSITRLILGGESLYRNKLHLFFAQEASLPHYLLIDKEEGVPIGWVDVAGLWHKMTPQGGQTPLVGRFYDQGICTFINEETGALHSLHSFHLHLDFEQNPQGLASLQYPGFFLGSIQECFFFLHNHVQERRVIVPNASLFRRNKKSSSPKVGFCLPQGHFLFTEESSSGLLLHHSSLAYERLFTFYYLKKEYQKAATYLPFLNDWGVHSLVYQMGDSNPEATGLAMRFFLHLYDLKTAPVWHPKQGKLEGREKKNRSMRLTIIPWILSHYQFYLVHASNQTSNAIPFALRLSIEEERRFLEIIKSYSREHPEFWTPNLDRRWSLLNGPDLKCKVHLFRSPLAPFVCTWQQQRQEEDMPLLLPDARIGNPSPIQEQVRIPSCRFSKELFLDTFHRILQANPNRKEAIDLDLFLLARSKIPSAILLLYVRENPELFQSDKENEDIEQIYQKILSHMERVWKALPPQEPPQVVKEYLRTCTLTIVPEKVVSPLAWNLSQRRLQLSLATPLPVFERFFEMQRVVLEVEPFALRDFHPKTATEGALLEQLAQGKAQMPMTQVRYAFRWGCEVQMLKEALEEALKEQRLKALESRCSFETLANWQPSDLVESVVKKHLVSALQTQVRRQGRQFPELRKVILQALLKKDPNLLRQYNPTLSPYQVECALIEAFHYFSQECRCIQIEEALHALNQGQSIERVGELCAWSASFDPTENPELLVMICRTKRLVRKRQEEIVAWEGGQREAVRLFEAPGGLGKSSFLKSIFMERALRENKVSVAVVSRELLSGEWALQRKMLYFTFEQGLLFIDLPLDAVVDAEGLQSLLQQLHRALREHKHLMLTPETLYAFHLKYYLALCEEDLNLVEKLGEIRQWFRLHTIGLIDEARINLSPLTQAKIGIGHPVAIPQVQQELILETYRLLLQPLFEEQLQLRNGEQPFRKDEIEALLPRLAEELSTLPLLNIPASQRSAVLAFWLQPSAEMPPYLTQMHQASHHEGQLIALVKGLLSKILPTALKMISGMDYGPSVLQNEWFSTPRLRCQPTAPYFEDPYLTLCLSIQDALQHPLDYSLHFLAIRRELKRMYGHEVQRGVPLEKNSAVVKVQEWLGSDAPSIESLETNESVAVKAFERLKNHPEVILWFLKEIVLPQVSYVREALIVSPTDLVHSFASATLFSAYVGVREIYPLPEQSYETALLDNAFHATVFQRLCHPSNRKFFELNPLQAHLCLEQLARQEATLFTSLAAIIDIGGFFKKAPIDLLVKEFLAFLQPYHYDGILFFKENQLYLWRQQQTEADQVSSTDLKHSLQRLGLEESSCKLLTLFDPPHAAGADLPLPSHALVLLLLGNEVGTEEIIQGAMRARNLLTTQTLCWGIPTPLKESLEAKGVSVTPESVLQRAVENEAAKIEGEVVLKCHQEADFLLRQSIEKEMESLSASRQVKLFQQHRSLFVSDRPIDPYQLFAAESSSATAAVTLKEYVDKRVQKLGGISNFLKRRQLTSALTPIIARACKLLGKGASPKMGAMRTVCRQEQLQQVEQQVKQQWLVGISPSEPHPLPASCTLSSATFLKEMKGASMSLCKKFRTAHLTPQLFITPDALHTAELGGVPLEERYLKPLQFLLWVQDPSDIALFILSKREAGQFQCEMAQVKETPCSVVLFNALGQIEQRSGKAIAIEEQLLFRDALIDLALIQGQATDLERLSQRLASWSDFWAFWQALEERGKGPSLEMRKMLQALMSGH